MSWPFGVSRHGTSHVNRMSLHASAHRMTTVTTPAIRETTAFHNCCRARDQPVMRRLRLAVHPPSLKHQSVGDGAGPAAWLIVAIAKPITFSLERRPRPNHTSRGEHT